MTVKELITLLQELPPDAPVAMYDTRNMQWHFAEVPTDAPAFVDYALVDDKPQKNVVLL